MTGLVLFVEHLLKWQAFNKSSTKFVEHLLYGKHYGYTIKNIIVVFMKLRHLVIKKKKSDLLMCVKASQLQMGSVLILFGSGLKINNKTSRGFFKKLFFN